MPPLTKTLAYLSFAAAALLTCVSGIDSHDADTGAFSLVFQRVQEATPSGILNRTGQTVVLDHPFDVQVFHSDKPIATNQAQCGLVTMLMSQVCNASVSSAQLFDGLSSVLSAPPLSTDGPLLPSQLGKFISEKARIWHVFAIGCGQEVLQPNVYADRWVLAWLNLDFAKVTRKDSKPAVGFALDRDRLDLALDLPVHLDFHGSDCLNTQLAVNQLNAVSVGRELHRLELALVFEPRITWLFAGLDAAKESLEGFVEPSEGCLTATEVQLGKLDALLTEAFEKSGLVSIEDVFSVAFPGSFSMVQRVVVDAPMQVQRELKSFGLIVVWIEQEFIGASHTLLSLLIVNVLPNCGLTHASDCSGVVASRPESWQSGTQAVKLFAEDVRGIALESIDDLGDAKHWIGFYKQVNVIWADAHLVNLDLKLFGLLANQVFKSFDDLTFKHWPAVLWAPHDVVLERVDRATVSSVSSFHALHYTNATGIVKRFLSERRIGASSVA